MTGLGMQRGPVCARVLKIQTVQPIHAAMHILHISPFNCLSLFFTFLWHAVQKAWHGHLLDADAVPDVAVMIIVLASPWSAGSL